MENERIRKRCLNCGRPVSTPYCPYCGQSIQTRRFSLQQVVIKDTLKNAFDLRKGFTLTLRHLFQEPGSMLRRYLYGAREGYMNYLSFLLVLLVMDYLLAFFSSVSLTDLTDEGEAFQVFERFLETYNKIYLFIIIPFNALITYWFFRRAAFNFAEHLVAAVYKQAGVTALGFFFIITTYFIQDRALLRELFPFNIGLQLLYAVLFYYSLFRIYYRYRMEVALRSVLATLLAVTLSNAFVLAGLAIIVGIKQAAGG